MLLIFVNYLDRLNIIIFSCITTQKRKTANQEKKKVASRRVDFSKAKTTTGNQIHVAINFYQESKLEEGRKWGHAPRIDVIADDVGSRFGGHKNNH